MLGLPGQGVCPLPAPSATYEADGVTYNLLIVEGKPTWIQQRDGGSLGAAGPGGTRAQADRNLVDGTILGRAPPKTDTAEEITMADVVPLNRRGYPAGDPVHGGGPGAGAGGGDLLGQGRWRVLDEADSHVGPAELDGGVRPPIHLQVHLLGLDHIPASREDAATATLRTPDQGTRRYPPITAATVTAIAGKKYINKHLTRVLGFGGVRPRPAQHQRMGSGGQGEVQDHRGLHVQVLQGLLEGEPWGDTAAPDYGVAQGQGHLPAAGDGQAPGAAI